MQNNTTEITYFRMRFKKITYNVKITINNCLEIKTLFVITAMRFDSSRCDSDSSAQSDC